jgi:hypothetical protein
VAPERARDGVSTAESDLWSLGATLYAAVEGRSPFARPTTLATLTALATSPPDPPQRAGPLRPVLSGLLRKDPKRRSTVDEVDRLLRRVIDPNVKPRPRLLPHPRRAAVPVPIGESTTVKLGGAPAAGGRPLFGPGRRRATVLAAVVVLLVASLGTAFALTRDGAGTPTGAGPDGSTSTGGTPRSSGAAAGQPSPFPCGTYESAATTQVTPGPVPSGLNVNVAERLTWYQDPGKWRIGAPLGWRTFKEPATTCFVDKNTSRTLSVTDHGALKVDDPPGYWRTEEKRLKAAKSLPGYEHAQIYRLDTWSGGARWDFVYLAGGEKMRVVRDLIRIQGRVFVVSWTCPAFNYDEEARTDSVYAFYADAP